MEKGVVQAVHDASGQTNQTKSRKKRNSHPRALMRIIIRCLIVLLGRNGRPFATCESKARRIGPSRLACLT